MNIRNFVIVLLFAGGNCFGLDYSIDNNLGATNLGTPRLPTTGPADSFVVPSPLSNSGNLIVTGNVRGGKHFRGVVPYSATPDFDATLGSSTLSSFLRRSASVDYRAGAGTYQPYYLPSKTVSAIRRGSVSGLEWTTIRRSKGTGDFVTGPPQKISERSYEPVRPLSMSPYEIERLISEDYSKQDSKELSEAIRKGRDEIFTRDLSKGLEDETKQRIVDKSQRPPVPEGIELKIAEPETAINPETFYFAEETAEQKTPDIFEQMRQDAQQQFEEEAIELEQRKTKAEPPEIKRREPEDIYKFSTKEIDPATAKALRGVHKTFATRASDKFNSYMRTAEDLMKRGRFYRAADAYTLASLYKPDDPLPYAGKSHSLLASGEYMSSAYYLAKAINMFGEYVNFKVDLLAMIGDRDKLESRIADIVTWQKKSGSGELQFLLGYVYYQTGKLKEAKETIDDAAKKIPDSFAVTALKKVIDATVGAGNN